MYLQYAVPCHQFALNPQNYDQVFPHHLKNSMWLELELWRKRIQQNVTIFVGTFLNSYIIFFFCSSFVSYNIFGKKKCNQKKKKQQ